MKSTLLRLVFAVAALAAGSAASATAPAASTHCQQIDPPSGPSRWWNQPDREYDVDIDGHDFDFIPDKSGMAGYVDGPCSHNGRFDIRRNTAASAELTLHVQAGTNDRQDSDFDVTLTIDRSGTCCVSGSVSGRAIARQSVKVTGTGNVASPFRAEFESNGKKTVITWRPE